MTTEAPPLTVTEVHQRCWDALRSYQSRTAIDLTDQDSLRIVVSDLAYLDLRREAPENPAGWPRAVVTADGHFRIGGIIVIPDPTFPAREVRLRTELAA